MKKTCNSTILKSESRIDISALSYPKRAIVLIVKLEIIPYKTQHSFIRGYCEECAG